MTLNLVITDIEFLFFAQINLKAVRITYTFHFLKPSVGQRMCLLSVFDIFG